MSTHEENDFKCDKCSQSFKWKHDLQRHVMSTHEENHFKCEICELECSRKDLLNRHMKTAHTTKQFQCEICEFTCGRKDNLNRHIDSHTKTKSQVTKRKATNSASNEKKRTKLYMDDDIFNSDDEDQIFNEAYNFNNQKRNKIDSFEDYDGVESDWEKVEEGLGEISESEWERLFGIVPEMEIEAEEEKETPMDIDPIKKHTFKCQKCLFRSIHREEFEEHIRTSHGIQCDICKQQFKHLYN